jgi:hypothetical protein
LAATKPDENSPLAPLGERGGGEGVAENLVKKIRNFTFAMQTPFLGLRFLWSAAAEPAELPLSCSFGFVISSTEATTKPRHQEQLRAAVEAPILFPPEYFNLCSSW